MLHKEYKGGGGWLRKIYNYEGSKAWTKYSNIFKYPTHSVEIPLTRFQQKKNILILFFLISRTYRVSQKKRDQRRLVQNCTFLVQLSCKVFISVSDPDPDPYGSVSFGRIRIRIKSSNQKLPLIRIRIRIQIKMIWIRNPGLFISIFVEFFYSFLVFQWPLKKSANLFFFQNQKLTKAITENW